MLISLALNCYLRNLRIVLGVLGVLAVNLCGSRMRELRCNSTGFTRRISTLTSIPYAWRKPS